MPVHSLIKSFIVNSMSFLFSIFNVVSKQIGNISAIPHFLLKLTHNTMED